MDSMKLWDKTPPIIYFKNIIVCVSPSAQAEVSVQTKHSHHLPSKGRGQKNK